jgi:ferredoxin like protein
MNISIEERLGLVSFEVDKEKHIKVDTSICRDCIDKPCLKFCPARRYTLEKGEEIAHDYEGCLECGTCKFACPRGAVDFSYPRGGYGVYYRYG